MRRYKGLFIEDEKANIDTYTRLFGLVDLELDSVEPLLDNPGEYYQVVVEREIDFLVIDYHLDKQVTYKGIDVLNEIRKQDGTIYAILLTNYELNDFASQFGKYDYEVKKDDMVKRYEDIAQKIKRACANRNQSLVLSAMHQTIESEDKLITLLEDINTKLDEKSDV